MLTLDEEDYEALGYGDIQAAYYESPVIPVLLERRRLRVKKWRESPAGQIAFQKSCERYRQSEKGKEAERKRRASEKYRARYKAWSQSPAGKKSKRKANQKAWQKEKALNEQLRADSSKANQTQGRTD